MKKPIKAAPKKSGKPKMKTPGRNVEICPGDMRIDLPKKRGGR